MRKEDREFYDKLGICVCCGKAKRAEGHAQCPKCLERGALYQAKKRASATPEMKAEENAKRREVYNRRRDAGLCPQCGKPATHGIYCYEHSIKIKRYNMKTAERMKRERHERGLVPDYRKANRLCLRCGAPIEDGNDTSYCNSCIEKIAECSRRTTTWRSFKFGRALYGQADKSRQADAR